MKIQKQLNFGLDNNYIVKGRMLEGGFFADDFYSLEDALEAFKKYSAMLDDGSVLWVTMGYYNPAFR